MLHTVLAHCPPTDDNDNDDRDDHVGGSNDDVMGIMNDTVHSASQMHNHHKQTVYLPWSCSRQIVEYLEEGLRRRLENEKDENMWRKMFGWSRAINIGENSVSVKIEC